MHIKIIAQKLFRPQISRALIPIIVIVFAWSLFFWRVLTPVSADRLTFQQGDFTLQFLAYREIAYNQILNERLPVFTECLYSGYPFQADPQSQVLYPPVMFLMLLGKTLAWPSLSTPGARMGSDGACPYCCIVHVCLSAPDAVKTSRCLAGFTCLWV